MKNAVFIIFLVIWGCSKQNARTPPMIIQELKTISYKSDGWGAYPYAGGPGEDSLYSCWSPTFDQLPDFLPENIVSVLVNTREGRLMAFKGPEVDYSYYYVPGNELGNPKAISLWWIQKQPGTIPSADSVFINYKPLR